MRQFQRSIPTPNLVFTYMYMQVKPRTEFAATAFWMRYYASNKDVSSLSSILFPSCFFTTKHALMLSLESLHFHRRVAFDKPLMVEVLQNREGLDFNYLKSRQMR